MTEAELKAELAALKREIDAAMKQFKADIALLENAIISLSELDEVDEGVPNA